MINLDIKWSEPYKYENKNGFSSWRRHWLIPPSYRSQFFQYWKANSFKLKDKGYNVSKQENDWFLTETKISLSEFSVASATPTPPKSEETPLVPIEVKDKSGLRPWQCMDGPRLPNAGLGQQLMLRERVFISWRRQRHASF